MEGIKMDIPNLIGKIIINGKIVAVTGLHIGGSQTKLEIGGVDTPVIRDPLTNRPYIPGSSLKGKMRSLLEKTEGKKQNTPVGKGIKIHTCTDPSEFSKCNVCKIFGLPGEKEFAEPTRLIVRDAPMTEESAERLKDLELEYTEVKWENVIDRITSAANPRQMERVPPSAEFEFEMIYNVFNDEDKQNLKHLYKAMELLEHDYLGGQGTRGYGKIVFKDIKIYWNSKNNYETGDVDVTTKSRINDNYSTPTDILKNFDTIVNKIR